MRGLSETFMKDLDLGEKEGVLNPITERLQQDTTLDLQIRKDCFNIYYRGGNLMRLRRTRKGYRAEFDTKYCAGTSSRVPSVPPTVTTRADALAWVEAFQELKLFIDIYFAAGKGAEREAQQIIVRDNNRGEGGTASDFFICDIEFALGNSRFDLVGVHWPSTGASRKKQEGHRLVLMELKFGDKSHKGSSGLRKHVQDMTGLAQDPKRLASFREEMKLCFNQKVELGVIDCPKPIEGFSAEPPLFMFILANHDPAKSALAQELKGLPGDILIATGNFMGYGLFDPAIYPLADFPAFGEGRV